MLFSKGRGIGKPQLSSCFGTHSQWLGRYVCDHAAVCKCQYWDDNYRDLIMLGGWPRHGSVSEEGVRLQNWRCVGQVGFCSQHKHLSCAREPASCWWVPLVPGSDPLPWSISLCLNYTAANTAALSIGFNFLVTIPLLNSCSHDSFPCSIFLYLSFVQPVEGVHVSLYSSTAYV